MPTQQQLALLAAVFLVLWGLQVAWRIRWARGPQPAPAQPTGEFAELTPAVVHLITANRVISHDAAAATVIDLAARGVLGIEEVGPNLSLVRLRRQEQPLRPYEQQVFDHLRSLAGPDGVVATEALAEGSRDLDKWWERFSELVTAEARGLGLTRKVRGIGSGMSLTGLIAFCLLGAAVYPHGALVPAVAFSGLLLMTVFTSKVTGERLTSNGRVAAGQWLTEREHLNAIANVARLPAAAVTMWGRPFAHVAAMGLSRSVASLPIVTSKLHAEAWSNQGGLWHKVKIRYPGQAGKGSRGATNVMLWLVFLIWSGTTLGGSIWYATHDFRIKDIPPILFSTLMLFGGGLVVLALVIVIGWPLGLVIHLLWRARAADPSPDIVVQGKVIRRTNATMSQGPGGKVYIAIDDGHRVIYAYRTTIGQARGLAEGDEVRAWVSNQGFLAGFEVLSRRSG